MSLVQNWLLHAASMGHHTRFSMPPLSNGGKLWSITQTAKNNVFLKHTVDEIKTCVMWQK
jgi:hypothetical protein